MFQKLHFCLFGQIFFLTILGNYTLCSADYTTLNLPDGAIARFGKGSINDVKFSPDSKFIAIGCPTGIWLYDAQTHDEIALLTDDSPQVNSVAFSPNGQFLAGGGHDIRLWSGTEKHQISLIENQRDDSWVSYLKFSPDNQMLATYIDHGRDEKYTLQLFSIAEKRIILELTATSNYGWKTELEFSHDGQTLLYADGDDIKMLKIAEKRVSTVLTGKAKGDVAASFSSDGWVIAYEDGDEIKLWSPHKMRVITTFKKHIEKYHI